MNGMKKHLTPSREVLNIFLDRITGYLSLKSNIYNWKPIICLEGFAIYKQADAQMISLN